MGAFGNEWREIVAEGNHPFFHDYGWCIVPLLFVVALALQLLENCGVDAQRARFRMVEASSGFFAGFLIDAFLDAYCNLLRLRLVRPFLMMFLGSSVIVWLQRWEPRSLSTECIDRVRQLIHQWGASPMRRHVTILAMQLAMALSWETAIDDSLRDSSESKTDSGLFDRAAACTFA